MRFVAATKLQFSRRYKTALNFHPQRDGVTPKLKLYVAVWRELHLHRKDKISPKLSILNWAVSVGPLYGRPIRIMVLMAHYEGYYF